MSVPPYSGGRVECGWEGGGRCWIKGFEHGEVGPGKVKVVALGIGDDVGEVGCRLSHNYECALVLHLDESRLNIYEVNTLTLFVPTSRGTFAVRPSLVNFTKL